MQVCCTISAETLQMKPDLHSIIPLCYKLVQILLEIVFFLPQNFEIWDGQCVEVHILYGNQHSYCDGLIQNNSKAINTVHVKSFDR